ncbi:hypothetical protein L0657_26875 [Dyadobacter sp. CY345]|uniref:hypothetical protein n=1 Tax=Dyadobacter sp. CY345 TaxID=2909335 RepID=UPI001F43404A|nr:hypothetical protein [Dyadobacter sp. CY345]MCF2447608.1 hypothetical protein [Dyadobacter sp. CY345]
MIKNPSDPNAAMFTLLSRYELGEKSAQLLLNLSNALTYYMVKDNLKEKIVQQYLNTQSAGNWRQKSQIYFHKSN